jgi:hypothetical protein
VSISAGPLLVDDASSTRSLSTSTVSRAASRRRFSPRVVEDRIEPRLQIRPALESVREAKGLDERILHEILRVGAIARQPQCGRIQRIQKGQDLRRKRIRVRWLTTSEHPSSGP